MGRLGVWLVASCAIGMAQGGCSSDGGGSGQAAVASGGTGASASGGSGGSPGGAAGTGGAAGADDWAPHCEFEELPPPVAAPAADPTAVRVGHGRRVISLPVGTPMGGYGARATNFLGNGEPFDARAGRWSEALVPSAGAHDSLTADAVALEAGGQRLVILRADLPVVTENALYQLEKEAAPDGSLQGRIVLTASHSHAGYAAWVPSFNLAPGMDAPRRDLFDRLVRILAEAVVDAIDDLEPAQVGLVTAKGLDPDRRVARDRRGENDSLLGPDGNDAGKGKDPWVWALRADRLDGSPKVALISIAMHGTVGSEFNPLASTDAPGAVQRALSSELGYPVLHVQGAAGDVSPAGTEGRMACPNPERCLDLPRLEALGARAAEVYGPLVEGITTTDTAALEVVTQTFETSWRREVQRPDGTVFRYPEPDPDYFPDGEIFDEEGNVIPLLDEFNANSGAALCGNAAGSPFPMNGTVGLQAYGSCMEAEGVGSIFMSLFGLPPDTKLPLCDTARTTVTAARISLGDDDEFLLLTLPGEPTAPLASYLRGRSPAGEERTLLVGYAQDYMGYVLTTEDWLAGGYEPSINMWGPLEGEMVLDGALAAAELAWTQDLEQPGAAGSRAPEFPFPPVKDASSLTTTDHGTLPSELPDYLFLPDTTEIPAEPEPAATVRRIKDVARLVWFGGDPAVDLPLVTVEQETAPGVFSEVPGMGSERGSVVLTYTPQTLEAEAPQSHIWAATWQPVPAAPFSTSQPGRPYSLQPGQYRLRVVGSTLTDGGEQSYELTSRSFEVVAADLDVATYGLTGDSLSMTALLGATPGLRALRDGVSDVDVPLPGPWAVTITLDDDSELSEQVSPDAAGVAGLSLAAGVGARVVAVTVVDAYGNGGALTLQ